MRTARLILAAAAFLLAARPSAAAETDPPEAAGGSAAAPMITAPVEAPTPSAMPPYLRWMIHPRRDGMLISLPVVDTDPNRGTTYGVMPVWVIQGGDRITQIHAPSLTYNKEFGLNPTYRLYYYPTPDSTLVLRGSASTKSEKEVMGHFVDRAFLGKSIDFSLRVQFEVSGSNRFYGLGPDSAKKDESDYTGDVLQYDVGVGVPLVPKTHWMVYAKNRLMGEKIYGGKITRLPDIGDRFPGVAPVHRQQVNESRVIIGYDSRDNAVTTTQGAYLQTFAGMSGKKMASAYDYSRYGFDGRYFHRWEGKDQVTAVQFKYEQLMGNAPFWLLSSIGGKYNLRAYGESRFLDRGAMFVSAEQRFTLYKARMAGVTTEFELAPFVGLGEVFDTPGRAASRYARPLAGAAIRAVARPQVVGSVDVGFGQEGVAVFMDINYSF